MIHPNELLLAVSHEMQANGVSKQIVKNTIASTIDKMVEIEIEIASNKIRCNGQHLLSNICDRLNNNVSIG